MNGCPTSFLRPGRGQIPRLATGGDAGRPAGPIRPVTCCHEVNHFQHSCPFYSVQGHDRQSAESLKQRPTLGTPTRSFLPPLPQISALQRWLARKAKAYTDMPDDCIPKNGNNHVHSLLDVSPLSRRHGERTQRRGVNVGMREGCEAVEGTLDIHHCLGCPESDKLTFLGRDMPQLVVSPPLLSPCQ